MLSNCREENRSPLHTYRLGRSSTGPRSFLRFFFPTRFRHLPSTAGLIPGTDTPYVSRTWLLFTIPSAHQQNVKQLKLLLEISILRLT